MRNLLITVLGISALISTACSREEVIDGRRNGNGDRLRMSIHVPTLAGGAATRAGGGVAFEEGENTINSLYLLFFAQSVDGTGRYITYVDVPMPVHANPQDNIMEMNIDTEVPMTSPLDAGNAYNILAIANISDDFYLDKTVDKWMSGWTDKTENEVTAAAMASLPTAISPTSLLMHGRMEKPAEESQVHLLLARDVSRFDVVNEVRNAYDLVTVSVWNGYNTTSIWGDGIMDYSAAKVRTRFHYTVSNEGKIRAGETDILDDIKGGLYSFENQVPTPEDHDNLTTCLIVGLRDRTSADIGYYRVNMTGNTGAQVLRRNHVYKLTITGVTPGGGAPDEETAYLGKSNKLIYFIDNWNVDDNGLAVRDEYSVLSIPTKKVAIGRDSTKVELSIHTFSTLSSPAPLTVRSQTYRPVSDNIEATLDGNTLEIIAKKLTVAENERNGVIVLSYAGLEISLSVVQSGVHDDYLHVTLPDGGIPRFPAYAGIPSGLINVQATGSWTAKLYMDGFSFNPSTALAPVAEITSKDNLVIDDSADRTIKKFRIYTHSFNMDLSPRDAFILVTLDKAPKTYLSVIRLSQDFVKKLYVRLPTDNADVKRETAVATFNGAGSGLAAGIADNTDKFFVIPGENENGEILRWGAAIVMNGLTDDSSHFETVTTKTDIADPMENYVTVKAKGLNTSGREYKATLRVQTDPGTFADITLVQQPANWNVPKVTTAIPAIGGQTAQLTLDAPAGMHYVAEIESVSGIEHFAYLVDPAETSGNVYSKLKAKKSTEPFVVGFPKLLYPNLYNPVTAIVKVTIVESGQSKTFSVTQMPPAQYNVNILNVGMSWFAISASVNIGSYTAPWAAHLSQAYIATLNNTSNFGLSGIVRTNGPLRLASVQHEVPAYWSNVWSDDIKNSVRYIHYVRPGFHDTASAIDADSEIWNWINSNDGVTFINSEEEAGINSQRDFGPNRVPGRMGLIGSGDFNGTYGINNASGNKVLDYLTNGPFGSVPTTTTFTTAGVSCRIETASVNTIPEAVPVLLGQGGTVNGYTLMMIDPKRRVIVKGDSEIFYDPNVKTDDQIRFMQNLQAWIVNTAQFGSHFSEYFWNSPRVAMPEPQPQP